MGKIREPGGFVLAAVLAVVVGVPLGAATADEPPAAPFPVDVPAEVVGQPAPPPSRGRRPNVHVVPELQDENSDKVPTDEGTLFPELTAPIAGLDGSEPNVSSQAPAPPVRWLDVNDQFLNEGDPFPPGQDPYREWPEVGLGWFCGAEIVATAPRVHSELNSAVLGPGDQISGTFVNTFQLPDPSLNWTVMPRVFVGYRMENGLGEILLGYRFVQSTGSNPIPAFDAAGAGQLDSRVTLNVIDLDYGYTDPDWGLPWYLPRVVRRTMGLRFASALFDSSAAGAQIQQERAGNVFLGIGPRVNFEGTWPTAHPDLAFTGGVDATGMIGFNYQRYGEQALVGGNLYTASARTDGTTSVAPVLRVQCGVNWTPDWGDRDLRFSAGFQWEQWWFVTDTDSMLELTLMGPYVRSEFRW